MQLALCLYGEPRFIQNQIASDYYKEFLLNKYDVHIYGHTWIADKYQPSTWSSLPEISGSQDTEEKIREQYPGIFLRSEPSRIFDANNLNRNNVLSQIYSINEVANMVENPDQYQFIFFGRYDLLLARLEGIKELEPGYYSTLRHPSLADQFLFSSPKYLPTFKMYDDIIITEGINEKIFIEEYKLKYFYRIFPGDVVLKHDFTVDLIRSL